MRAVCPGPRGPRTPNGCLTDWLRGGDIWLGLEIRGGRGARGVGLAGGLWSCEKSIYGVTASLRLCFGKKWGQASSGFPTLCLCGRLKDESRTALEQREGAPVPQKGSPGSWAAAAVRVPAQEMARCPSCGGGDSQKKHLAAPQCQCRCGDEHLLSFTDLQQLFYILLNVALCSLLELSP